MQSARPACRAPSHPCRRLHGATAAAKHGGGSTRVLHSPAPLDATAAAPCSGTMPAATPVVPASDLQTRQLRLLPWQTNGSKSFSRQGSPGSGSDNDSSSTAAPAVAGAPPAGPATSQSNGGSSGTLRPQRRRAATENASSNLASTKDATASGSDGSSTGRLAPWRQRPDYRPGGPLLTLQDVNLAALDSTAGSGNNSGSEGEEGEPATNGISSGRRPRRKTGPMSEERRQAISRALQNKGSKSAEHKRSISRAMREAHARNPELRRSAAGRRKRCGYCGQEGHNRRACPQLLAEEATAQAAAASSEQAGAPLPAKRIIVIEEVDEPPEPPVSVATDSLPDNSSSSGAGNSSAAASSGSSSAVPLSGAPSGGAAAIEATAPGSSNGSGRSAPEHTAANPTGVGGARPTQPPSPASSASSPLRPPPFGDLLPTRQLAPGMALSPEGGWIFSLPHSKEECVVQAAKAVLRAWDDGMRRQAVELLLPQADPTADGGWPGGIRQQFRVAKPMVENLLLRLKQHEGLGGRITAELLDEGDCVAAWQSERLGALLFATADTLPDLRRIDDALSGERLTLVINPQWQTQGQVISDFGFGRARKAAERFVAGFEEVYYLRRVRIFGDDVRIMRCYPGQWQVHYVPPEPRTETVLLSCEDAKPTFQRLIQLLKAVRGSRASKTWLDRVLTSSIGNFNEFAAFSPEEAAAAAAAASDSGESRAASTAATAASQGEIGPEGEGKEGEQEEKGKEGGAEVPRDIVTGEPLGFASSKARARDIRLEPINQIAKWLP